MSRFESRTKDESPLPASSSWAHLRHIDVTEVLRSLSREDAQAVMGMAVDRTYPSGSCIFDFGEQQQGLYLVKSGLVEEFRLTAAGNKLPINRIGPGKLFALSTVGGRLCCVAEAVEDSVIGVLSFQRLEEISRRFPRVAVNMVELLAGRMGQLEERLQVLAFQRLRARVAWAILALYQIHGSRLDGVTHEVLAGWAASSRPKVSVVLAELQRMGLVRLARGAIEVVDAAGLEEWVKR